MNSKIFTIEKEKTALLIIDIQEKLLAAMPENVQEILIKNTNILAAAGSLYNLPLLVSEQYRKGLGPTVPAVLKNIKNQKILEKIHFNCIKDIEIKNSITAINRQNIIIAGIESHICVLQTALGLLELGRNVIVASDAVASRNKHNWKMALAAMQAAGCVIYPTETIAFMLLEKAGTKEFKTISPLLK